MSPYRSDPRGHSAASNGYSSGWSLYISYSYLRHGPGTLGGYLEWGRRLFGIMDREWGLKGIVNCEGRLLGTGVGVFRWEGM